MTNKQQQILNQIREEIAAAKRYSNYRDYYNEVESRHYSTRYSDYDVVLEREGEAVANRYKKYWEMKLNNKALTHCNSRTLAALEREGYIKIIHDSKNDAWGIDTVELLKEEH